ncbi:MAG TPA: hypothetical protein VHG71_04430 [Verrucomicrobiae bacterium]|nr:hypothetical protein [Verrucomicrobiae bacterium]
MAVGIPCLLIFYVLSMGPFVKLQGYGIIGERTANVLGIVYVPLALLAPIPGVRSFFNWYIFHVWNCDTMGDNTL